jgi:Tfp pilus assembly protein PilF
LELRRRALGSDDPHVIAQTLELAVILYYEKQSAPADAVVPEMMEKARRSTQQVSLGGAWYNCACAVAVYGDNDAAIEYLQKADTLSPQSPGQLLTEFDFKSLRKDPRFLASVAKSKQRSESLA